MIFLKNKLCLWIFLGWEFLGRMCVDIGQATRTELNSVIDYQVISSLEGLNISRKSHIFLNNISLQQIDHSCIRNDLALFVQVVCKN